ncbi:MAG: CHAT domain-containing protein [Pseudomonadota bacterium]
MAIGIRDVAIAMLALCLAGCRADRASLDPLYDDGYRKLEVGDLGAAKAIARDGLRRAQSTGDEAWVWAFEVLDAEVLVGQRHLSTALDRLDAGLSVERPDDRVHARALMTRGYARCLEPDAEDEAGQADARARAQADLERAERMADALRMPELAAEVISRSGICAAMRGNPDIAEALFRKAMDAAERQGFRRIAAQAAGNIGNLRVETDECDDAVRWLGRSEELAAGLPADATRAKNLGRLGRCYYLLGDYERAAPVLSEAEALMRRLDLAGDRRVALQNLGRAQQGQGDHARASESYARAAVIAQAIEDREGSAEALADIQATRAALALERGNEGEATFRAEEALRIQVEHRLPAERLRTLLLLAEIRERREEPSRAMALYEEILGTPKAGSDLVWQAHAGLARLHARAGRPGDAEAEYRRAFERMEASLSQVLVPEHQLPFIARIGRFYDDYVEFLVDQGRTADALRVADESRARLLRERLRGAGIVPGRPADYVRLARDADALLLFYSTGAERSFLWAIDGDGVALVPLPGERALGALVDAHQRRILESRDPLEEGAPEAIELYRRLLQPVAAAISPEKRVIVVADGPLEQLNFETLVVPGPAPHYLIEDVVLMRTPSLRLLRAADAASSPDERSLLVLGDPVPPDPTFPVLPFAGREVAAIALQFAPAQRLIHTGPRAIPSAYRAAEPKRFDYIHLAAHAQTNSVVPLDSAVVLSAAAGEYKLYARDVVDVPLDAELVTLSTCRSAGARTFSGEGLVGLSWAFLSAGAKRVVGGLWPVEDASTADLMTGLYRRLAAGEEPVAALRHAKLTLLHSDSAYRKPYYWAPFVIYSARYDGRTR